MPSPGAPLPPGFSLEGGDVLRVSVQPYARRDEMLRQLRAMVAAARASGLSRLLADTHALGPHIDIVDRILLGAQMTEFWPKHLRTALWCTDAQINASRPFEHAATRAGHAIRVFTDHDAALRWLREADPGSTGP